MVVVYYVLYVCYGLVDVYDCVFLIVRFFIVDLWVFCVKNFVGVLGGYFGWYLIEIGRIGLCEICYFGELGWLYGSF